MRAAHLSTGRPWSPAVLLVAHGSSDPAAAATVTALAAAVSAALPGASVRTAYLDHTPPWPAAALAELAAAGAAEVTVVPLLFTAAYHGRVDLPAAVAAARRDGLRIPVRITAGLGPVRPGEALTPLLAGLCRRLTEAAAGVRYDAVVLAAAGTRDTDARATVDDVAGQLGARLGLPVLASYATAVPLGPAEAVARLRAAGAGRVAVAAYFLATGKLYRVAAADAYRAGAKVVAQPLGNAPELVEIICERVASVASLNADYPIGINDPGRQR